MIAAIVTDKDYFELLQMASTATTCADYFYLLFITTQKNHFVVSFHFIQGKNATKQMLDSLLSAKLIFVADSYQSRVKQVPSAIIDQHFILRNHCNRMFSAQAQYSRFSCTGINKARAIIEERKNLLWSKSGYCCTGA